MGYKGKRAEGKMGVRAGCQGKGKGIKGNEIAFGDNLFIFNLFPSSLCSTIEHSFITSLGYRF